MEVTPIEGVRRFGLFEVDLKAGQLRKNGTRVRLPQQPLRVLAVLVERAGTVVTREELRQRLWSPDIFVDFDHALNKSVQKLRDALGDSADSPLYIETIPRVGYRFLAPVSAVPGVAGQDAAAEAPSAGQGAAEHATTSPKATWFRRANVSWLLAVGSIVLLVAGARLVQSRQLRGARIHSIAVLPLDNLSGDPEQNYFADGMTDELTTMLARDSKLRVVSRTSAMQFKGVRKPLREIARSLGVDGIVEGSVERNSGEVHMTLQLIRGSSDTHIWAESYDRDANDTVSLPEQAALAIAKKTNTAVAGRAPERYVNPAAHDAYLHGRYLWFASRNDEAEKYFMKAVALQPDYALAWSGVSDYYGAGMVMGELDPRAARQPFEAAAEKAVELDGTLAQTHLSLCAAIFFSRWDLAGADQECRRAIELDPEFAEAYHLRAKLLSAMNRHEEAIASQKKAMELDPFARPWGLAYIYLLARQYDAAITEAKQRLESDPHNAWTLYILADAYRRKGMYVEFATAFERGLIADGDEGDATSARRAFEKGGFHAVVVWDLTSMKKKAQTHYVAPSDMALQYAQLGDREKALSLLEESYRRHSPLLLESLQSDPAYDFLHNDARYRALVREIGLPPAY
jgi:TolB-like protein/DNA-binding winged helix-turn-helix (wHTH) protein